MSLRTLAIIGGALALLLAVTLVWEANQGRMSRQKPPEPAVAKPLEISLLPEFKTSSLQERKETVERPLFVPTRRPAPPPEAVAEAPSKVERGLFVLSGTAIQGQTRIAFLRNAKDNKPKTVHVGDVVEGMNVSVITADKVVLTAGGQEEELLLKVATGPKGAVTPSAIAPPPQAQQQQAQPQPGQPAVRPSVRRTTAAARQAAQAAPVQAVPLPGNLAEPNQQQPKNNGFGP
ncbi:MAG: hypothetical protein LBE75_03850 [Burkholderiales bacterium]|jgi:type II secretory pathway component PulC|nr:hypothetical protein [Burkholderiales bacterium]